MGRIALVFFVALLTACQNMPEPYAPPEQRQPFENFRPYRVRRVIHMSDSDADSYIMKDIASSGNGVWRWTGQRPTVRVLLRTNENLHYTIDFAIAGVTFEQTGPVTLSFYVNDHLLDTVRYSSFGSQHFEKPVPPEWIKKDEQNTLAAEIDKMWISKDDGSRLGFILTSIGLQQE